MLSLLSMVLDSVEDVFMFLCFSSECKGHKKRKVHVHVQVYTTQSFAEACKPAVWKASCRLSKHSRWSQKRTSASDHSICKFVLKWNVKRNQLIRLLIVLIIF